MKVFRLFTFRSARVTVILFGVVVCARCTRGRDAPPPVASAADSSGGITRVRTGVNYVCTAARPLTATYVGDSLAIVSYNGASHRLHRAVSGSGARFTGDSLQWWIKGRDGTLTAGEEPQGTVIDRCKE